MSVQATAYSQSCEIEILGDIMNKQTYDAATEHYEPDYTQRACQMFPRCLLIDPDNPLETEVFNSKLQSFKWIEVTQKGETLICPTADGVKEGYSVEMDGEFKGMLYIEGNGKVGEKRTMRFIALWTDPISGYVYRFQKDCSLYVGDATDARPIVSIDSPTTVIWNPMRQQAKQKITAIVVCGNREITNDVKCRLFWVRVLNDGSREQIATNNISNSWEIADYVINDNNQIVAITIDRNMIGDSISYEVYSVYKAEGEIPNTYTLSDSKAVTTIVRRIPKLDIKYIGTSINVPSGVASVLCKAVVSDNAGFIASDTWDEHAKMRWERVSFSISNGKRVENVKVIGYGKELLVPVDETRFLRLTLLDRGNYSAIVDDEGNYIVDDSGNVIICKDLID